MNFAKRLALSGSAITLGLMLALASVLTVSNTPVHANSAPDLEVGTPSVYDASLSTGSQFTLSVTVTNAGDGESEATRLRYYRSTDSTITGSDTEQGSESVGALAAAGTSDHWGGLRAPTEAGTYYYGACVDSVTGESDTTNNCSSSVKVTVSEPAPDLVVIGIDATDNIVTGGSFRVGVTVTNQGDAQSAATTLRWKQLVDGTTTEIGTVAQRALTRPQGSFKTIRLTAPSTPGTSSYWACVDSVAGESDTTNNCSSSVQVTVTNNLATGTPTISGTAQVGQTLTASTSGIADTDGLTNVSYSYQWLSSQDTEIEGATNSTYTLSDDDEGKTIKVRVSFTDDAGNGESLTSAATVPVAAAPLPLTAQSSQVPDSHNGSGSFTFELRFSEDVTGLSYRTLRDHAFTVTGGEVTGARRLEPGSNVRWEITVSPDSDAAVSVVLPITTDCEARGAICAGDGRMQSNRLEITVSGPEEQANSPATGAPSISGTAQVGETLTASTSGIADADGLTNATFTYRWLAGDAAIQGATGSTYTLTSGEQGKTIKVRVTFSDDAGNEESLTSAATGAVAAAPSPLTAQSSQVPGSHDGNDSFTFELRFSEDVTGLSYRTLRDHAFTVTGGEVVKARRLQRGSNVGWEISVTPDSDAAVTVVLPVTTDCEARGAICTEDGRMLSSRLELTVSGPSG